MRCISAVWLHSRKHDAAAEDGRKEKRGPGNDNGRSEGNHTQGIHIRAQSSRYSQMHDIKQHMADRNFKLAYSTIYDTWSGYGRNPWIRAIAPSARRRCSRRDLPNLRLLDRSAKAAAIIDDLLLLVRAWNISRAARWIAAWIRFGRRPAAPRARHDGGDDRHALHHQAERNGGEQPRQ